MSREKITKPDAIAFFKKLWQECPFLETKIAPVKDILKAFELFYVSDEIKKFNLNLTRQDGSPFFHVLIEKEGKKKLYFTQTIQPKEKNQSLGYMQEKGAS